MDKIEKIDSENSEFFNEYLKNVEKGEMKIKDIIGFEIEKPSVFIPSVPCAYVVPNEDICGALESPASSVFSLAPLYNTLFFPIIPKINNEKKVTISEFKNVNSISLNDFLIFIEKGKIIPYFTQPYKNMTRN